MKKYENDILTFSESVLFDTLNETQIVAVFKV